MTSKNRNRWTRLNIGWKAEDEIIAVVERYVGPFERPEGCQNGDLDRNAKIDGFLYLFGKRIACQVKARENGDDILVEVWKDYERDLPGRDMITQAELYIVRNRSGIIYLIPTAAIKQAVKRLVESCTKGFDKQGWWHTAFGSLKLSRGEGKAEHKVVAFFNPDLFDDVYTINHRQAA